MPDIPTTDDNSMGMIKDSTLRGVKLDDDTEFTAFGPVPYKDGASFIKIIHPNTKSEIVYLVNPETKVQQNGPLFCKRTSGEMRLGHVMWNGSPYLAKVFDKEPTALLDEPPSLEIYRF